MSDIEGKAATVAARKCGGNARVSKVTAAKFDELMGKVRRFLIARTNASLYRGVIL
jgi:hypothetical protein